MNFCVPHQLKGYQTTNSCIIIVVVLWMNDRYTALLPDRLLKWTLGWPWKVQGQRDQSQRMGGSSSSWLLWLSHLHPQPPRHPSRLTWNKVSMFQPAAILFLGWSQLLLICGRQNSEIWSSHPLFRKPMSDVKGGVCPVLFIQSIRISYQSNSTLNQDSVQQQC